MRLLKFTTLFALVAMLLLAAMPATPAAAQGTVPENPHGPWLPQDLEDEAYRERLFKGQQEYRFFEKADGTPNLPDLNRFRDQFPEQFVYWWVNLVESWRPGCMNLLTQEECAIGWVRHLPLRDYDQLDDLLAEVDHTQGSFWLSPVKMLVIPQEGLTREEAAHFAYGHVPLFVSERFPPSEISPIVDTGNLHIIATYPYHWGCTAGEPDPWCWVDDVLHLSSWQEVIDLHFLGTDRLQAPLRFGLWVVEPAELNESYPFAAQSNQVQSFEDLLGRVPDLTKMLEANTETNLGSAEAAVPVPTLAATQVVTPTVTPMPTPTPGSGTGSGFEPLPPGEDLNASWNYERAAAPEVEETETLTTWEAVMTTTRDNKEGAFTLIGVVASLYFVVRDRRLKFTRKD